MSPRIGGKAAGLARLQQAGVAVPPYVVIEPDADPEAARGAIEALGLPLAVRSSALGEDSATHSFAGQYVSVLGVSSWDGVLNAVATCRASGQSDRVLAYCAAHRIEPSPVAVVVQRMVVGEASGVCFTATPDDPDRVLVSAAFGLGEGVVQGSVPCDTYRVTEAGEVEATVVHKDAAVVLVDGAPREVTIDRRDPVLADDAVRDLATGARRLRKSFGHELDIEFTVEGGKVWFLQARPVTTPIPRGRRLLWDNSNIIESYNGVTTPLTYSFAQHAYTIVYQLFLRVMGVSEAEILAQSSVYPRMIGLVRGRVYYNLNAWYRLVQILPGYKYNAAFMEQMMGVAEVAREQDVGDAKPARSLRDGLRLLKLIGVLGWRLRTIDGDVATFHAHFDRVYQPWRRRDLSRMAPEDLVEAYEVLERELLWAWSTPIVNDFLTMIFYGTLRKLCASWCGDVDAQGAQGQLHNELLSGEGGLESVAPMHAALAMAELLRGKVVPEFSLDEARAVPGFVAAWDSYIDKYGDRCVNELKLETPSLRQDPSFLVASLRNYLRAPPMDPSAEGRVRAEAEQRAFARLSGWRKLAFSRVLAQARARVRDRENLRFLRTRIFGLCRDIFRALGAHLVDARAIDRVEDVFYLAVPELLGMVRGTAVSVALRETIALRRREFEGYQAGAVPDDRFYTRGAVHLHNPFKRPRTATTGEGLVGTGVCPGVVEKEVMVLADPHEGARLDGQILAAFRTDPGWVPLYPAISGLLVERGSLLSHSAVVAREMGLPTIIGIPGLTAAVRTGDRLRMDGSTGKVEKL
ncbi:MAG: phosphoenolpyruvate synthase [Deltaproteobacteria bacterium]|nr:phosphoenolpyruvate synthase [Deltaproteobacteria bacterium]